jgi:hypothetical protein
MSDLERRRSARCEGCGKELPENLHRFCGADCRLRFTDKLRPAHRHTLDEPPRAGGGPVGEWRAARKPTLGAAASRDVPCGDFSPHVRRGRPIAGRRSVTQQSEFAARGGAGAGQGEGVLPEHSFLARVLGHPAPAQPAASR